MGEISEGPSDHVARPWAHAKSDPLGDLDRAISAAMDGPQFGEFETYQYGAPRTGTFEMGGAQHVHSASAAEITAAVNHIIVDGESVETGFYDTSGHFHATMDEVYRCQSSLEADCHQTWALLQAVREGVYG